MKQELITKQIKENKWLNGFYDMQDGDVMAMEVDKEYLDSIDVLRKDYSIMCTGNTYSIKRLIK